MPTLKICRCGELTDSIPCADCKRKGNRKRKPRPTTLVRDRERPRREAVVREHRQQFGNWCPGFGVPPHEVNPPNVLSADHIIPAKDGGTVLGVLCRNCNSRKGGGVVTR